MDKKGKAQDIWNGIPFHWGIPTIGQDGRSYTNLYIEDPTNPKEGKTVPNSGHTQIAVTNPADLDGRIHTAMARLAEEHQHYFFSQFTSGKFDGMTFNYYVSVRWDFFAADAWPTLAASNKNRQLWFDHLEPVLGNIPFKNLLTENDLYEAMNKIWHRKKSHREVSDEERKCWSLLSHIFEDAMKLGLIDHNPAKKYDQRYSKNSRTEALSHLNRFDLMKEELAAIFWEAIQMAKKGFSEGLAILLVIFLGIDIYEACGLDIDSIKTSGIVTEIEIRQEYYQRRNEDPILRECQRYSQYRRIPCTKLIAYLLRLTRKIRPSESPEEKALFIGSSGLRLSPDQVKNVAKNLQLKHVHTFDDMSVGGKKSSGLSRLGLLPSTAPYYFRTICDMCDDEIAVIIGNQRKTTIGEWYISWSSRDLAQAVLLYKMEIWHGYYFHLLHHQEPPHEKAIPIYFISGFACTSSVLSVASASGVTICRQTPLHNN